MSSVKGGSAEVRMTCNHTNLYPNPAPRFGELAWCHRCDEFKPVKIVTPIPHLPTPSTYTKTKPVTHYLNNARLPLRPAHLKHIHL